MIFNAEEKTVQQDDTAGSGPRGLQGRLLPGTQVGLSSFVFLFFVSEIITGLECIFRR